MTPKIVTRHGRGRMSQGAFCHYGKDAFRQVFQEPHRARWVLGVRKNERVPLVTTMGKAGLGGSSRQRRPIILRNRTTMTAPHT